MPASEAFFTQHSGYSIGFSRLKDPGRRHHHIVLGSTLRQLNTQFHHPGQMRQYCAIVVQKRSKGPSNAQEGCCCFSFATEASHPTFCRDERTTLF